MATYNQMLEKANELGYKTPSQAMIGIGRANFMANFKPINPQVAIETIYKKVVKKPIKKQFIRKPIGGKLVAFDDAYTIYPNGDVYSDYLGRLLTKIEEKSRKNIFLTMSIRRKKHQVNRLVMFHFGNHSYKNMSDMPIVSPIDKDHFNNNIENLEFATQAEVNKKYDLKPSEKCVKAPKIADTEIEKVKDYLFVGWSLEKIGNRYFTSPTSVARFIKRHNLKPLHK